VSAVTLERCAWLLVTAVVVASLLVPGISSASPAAAAETRVWAFELAGQVRVGDEAALTLELHRRCEPTYDQLASEGRIHR